MAISILVGNLSASKGVIRFFKSPRNSIHALGSFALLWLILLDKCYVSTFGVRNITLLELGSTHL